MSFAYGFLNAVSPCTSDCARANNCCGHFVSCCICGCRSCFTEFVKSCDGDCYCNDCWEKRCRESAESDRNCETCKHFNPDCDERCEGCSVDNAEKWEWDGIVWDE